jgi:hypothetical protein
MLSFVQQHPILLLGLLVVLSTLTSVVSSFVGLLSGTPARRHGRVVVDYVQRHGYQLLNPVLAQKLDVSVLAMVNDPALRDLARATSDITDIDRFEDGNDDWLAFRCTLASTTVTIFNFSQAPPLHSDSGPASFRVAKIRVDGLPRFSLEPHSLATAVEALTGRLLHQLDVTIDLASGSFGSRFRLRGSDRTAVADFFTPERIRFIEAEKLSGTLVSNAQYLVYYEATAMRSEADYDAFIAIVERIVGHFLGLET